MSICIKEARYIDGYRIAVVFNTGESAIIDFRRFIESTPWAKPLADHNAFQAFYLDEWPTLAWRCGVDIAPETVYELATGQKPEWREQAQAPRRVEPSVSLAGL